MIQDIAPLIFDNAYKSACPADSDTVIPAQKGRVLCRLSDERVSFPTVREAEDIFGIPKSSLRYLFSIDDMRFFLCASKLMEKEGYTWRRHQELRNAEPAFLSFAAAEAGHVAQWYEDHRFCSICAGPMRHDDELRALVCESCKKRIFPRINPVVITAVTDGDLLLAARYNSNHMRIRNNQYVLIAGYVEFGESLEQAVRREVKEETGLDLGRVIYVSSQPWPYSQSLIAGFYAEGDSSRPLKRQEDELSELVWVRREELPERLGLASITDNLFEWFRLGLSPEEVIESRRNM